MKFFDRNFIETYNFLQAVIVLVMGWLISIILRAAGLGHTCNHYLFYLVLTLVLSYFLHLIRHVDQMEENKKEINLLDSRVSAHDIKIDAIRTQLTRIELRSRTEVVPL
jgi:hypothetical protein